MNALFIIWFRMGVRGAALLIYYKDLIKNKNSEKEIRYEKEMA